jgi:2-dehydropantoate 2-reductase
MFSSIAIVGAGALGSYYGARLALAGRDVRFLMRSDLAAVRERGMTLREKDAVRPLARVAAWARPEEIGPVDLVIVTLKTTANAALATLLPPLLGVRTAVLTLQNGLGNEEQIAALVGAERVMGGLCYIGVTREAPGEITGYYTPGSMALGEFGRPVGGRVRAVEALFSGIGVKTRVVDNLAEARWQKLIWNVPYNGLAIAGGGITTDRILADPVLAAQVRLLMDEVAAAARHFGHEVSEAFIQAQIDVTPGMGAYRPSSREWRVRGRLGGTFRTGADRAAQDPGLVRQNRLAGRRRRQVGRAGRKTGRRLSLHPIRCRRVRAGGKRVGQPPHALARRIAKVDPRRAGLVRVAVRPEGKERIAGV